jgi:hypothetical protein
MATTNLEILLKRLEIVAMRLLNSSGGVADQISFTDMAHFGRTNEEKLLLRVIAALNGVVGGGEGSSFPSNVPVTNPDGAFDHMREDGVSAGTSVVDVLITILTQYSGATIVLNSLQVQLEKKLEDNSGVPGAYDGTVTFMDYTTYVEVGRGFKVVGFTFAIGDHNLTGDNSVKFYRLSTLLQENISDTGSPLTLTTSDDHDYSTVGVNGETKSYKCTVQDIGADGTLDITRESGYKKIVTVERVGIGTSTSATMDSVYSGAFDTFDMIEEDGDPGETSIRPKGDIVVYGNTLTNTLGQYFWIAYPKQWGAIQAVLQGATNPTDVIDAFYTIEEHTIINDFGVSTDYYFYRSHATKPFAEDLKITIQFS